MNKLANLSASDRKDVFTLASEKLGFSSPAVIEKDFWVCWVLEKIFSTPALSDILIFREVRAYQKPMVLLKDSLRILT